MLLDEIAYQLSVDDFARSRLGIVPDHWQSRLFATPAQKVILNCSRQSGKSTCSAIVATHRAIYTPESTVVLVSPSLRQSREIFRKIMWVLDRTETKRVEDNAVTITLRNGSRIIALPSAPDNIRGISAVSMLLEDEAAFCGDEIFTVVRPMLAVSGGRHIMMSTPRAKQGHFYNCWQDASWEKYMVTAYDCPRISREFLEEERRSLPDVDFRREYLCEFSDAVDAVFESRYTHEALTDDVEVLF